MQLKESWSLVVDTNQYSGNFERELCAYVTGMTSENAKGGRYDAFVALFRKDFGIADDVDEQDFPFADLVTEEVEGDDDVPYPSYCGISPTPGRSNDGHGAHYSVPDEGHFKHHAYESVRIYFARRPTAKEFDALKQRALAFPDAARSMDETSRMMTGPEDLRVIGVRLVKQTVSDEDVVP